MIETPVTPDPMAEESKYPNPMWELVRTVPHDSLMDWRNGRRFTPMMYVWDRGNPRRGIDMSRTRDVLVQRYAWAIANPLALDWMVEQLDGRGLIEVGAGRGYWAAQLALRGVNVLATDIAPPGTGTNGFFFPVKYSGGQTVFHPIVHAPGHRIAGQYPDRALFICWPPSRSEAAAHALAAYQAARGDMLFYCGENEPWCNASDSFFEGLGRDWEHLGSGPLVRWSGVYDHLDLYRRKRGTR